MTQTIETGVVYDHIHYGEVLVEQIGEMYNEYDVENKTGKSATALVYFYDNFDGYGGMPGGPLTEEATNFAQSVERVREHEYVQNDV